MQMDGYKMRRLHRWKQIRGDLMGKLLKETVIRAVYLALHRKEPGWGVAFGKDHRGNWYLRYPCKNDHDEPGGIMIPVYGRFGEPTLADAIKIVSEYLQRSGY
jgi:hypothetical protein